MSRWMIEKSGTGIEKSGTGIEKSGTGIERAGTGIERAGTGVEKSGTGIRQAMLACSLAIVGFASTAGASQINPEGVLNIVVDNDTIGVSWMLDGRVYSGVSAVHGSYARMSLFEVGIASGFGGFDVAGAGTGFEVAGAGTGVEVAGAGTGLEVAGAGTGLQVAGAGTGTQVAGAGTGIQVAGAGTGTQVTGAGTGTQVAGAGTGVQVAGAGTGTQVAGAGTGAEVTGAGTGSTINVAGAGTGQEAISITIPDGTGLQMEIEMGCDSAKVFILGAAGDEVISFDGVPVIGSTGFCGDGPGTDFGLDGGELH